MHEHLQYNSMNTLYGVGVSTIGNTCRLLINNMGLRRPHHSTETIQLYEFICTWGICTVKILRACTVYLSWVLGHTHAHNSMRSTLYVQSLAQAHVHVCTEYCAAFCYLLFFFWAKYCFFRYCFFCGAKVRQVYLLKDWSGTWISSISRFGKSLCFLLWTQNLAFY